MFVASRCVHYLFIMMLLIVLQQVDIYALTFFLPHL